MGGIQRGLVRGGEEGKREEGGRLAKAGGGMGPFFFPEESSVY